jgi:hypothetical protein
MRDSLLKQLLMKNNSISDKLIDRPVEWKPWGSPEINWKPWDGSKSIKRKEDQKKDI